MFFRMIIYMIIYFKYSKGVKTWDNCKMEAVIHGLVIPKYFFSKNNSEVKFQI